MPSMTMSIRRGPPLELYLQDVVRLRKPHPCGSFEWTIVRLGADIGLRCHGCNRKVLLPRRELEKRLKAFVSRGSDFARPQRLEEPHASEPNARATGSSHGAGAASGR
jgi:hypothetical protein